jgi:transcriptional/translational regulatory protein YebC/TACO1
MFDKKGVITIELYAVDEETLIEVATEAGAEDITSDTGSYEVVTPPEEIDTVRSAIEAKGIPMVSAEVVMRPKNSVRLQKESEAGSMLKMFEMLEEHDDVQKVYANFDIDEALLEKLT